MALCNGVHPSSHHLHKLFNEIEFALCSLHSETNFSQF